MMIIDDVGNYEDTEDVVHDSKTRCRMKYRLEHSQKDQFQIPLSLLKYKFYNIQSFVCYLKLFMACLVVNFNQNSE
jgi:hypothetical protein